jgi:hypothetical protein
MISLTSLTYSASAFAEKPATAPNVMHFANSAETALSQLSMASSRP